jgi:hypothetical protein
MRLCPFANVFPCARLPTQDEQVLRLAQALYASETAADAEGPAAAASAGDTPATPAVETPAPAQGLALQHAQAVDLVLKARAELEVRAF